MSSLFNIDRRSAFLLLWFLVFLIGLDLVPETNLLVLVFLSLAYGLAVFAPAYAVLRLLQRGGEGVLAAIALMVAILVLAVVAGSFEYQFRDTRTIPRDIFVGGASYLTGLVWKGGSPAPEVASSNVTARIDPGWVRQFIGDVNAMRAKFGVPPLAQNTTPVGEMQQPLLTFAGVCPDCGSSLIYENGCSSCRSCGYSRC